MIHTIAPYRYHRTWVFDDEKVGLHREAFVSGMDTILDKISTGKRFTLLFSSNPFPSFQLHLEWKKKEFRGNWYVCPELQIEAWLCSALGKYFQQAPKKIYIEAK